MCECVVNGLKGWLLRFGIALFELWRDRFTGATEKEAEEKAKAFLQQNYATPQRVTAPSEAEETSFAYFAITPLV